MAVNKARLIEVLYWAKGEWAKQEAGLPSEWYQADYVIFNDHDDDSYVFSKYNLCDTACCIAGRIALQDIPLHLNEDGAIVDKNNHQVDIDDHAQKALGLSSREANALFSGDNEIEDIERIVNQLVEGTFEDDDSDW